MGANMANSMLENMSELEELEWEPIEVTSMEETGLTHGFLEDMTLKVMYYRGHTTGYEIAEFMHLPFQNVVSPILDFLKREQMCEVKGSARSGLGAGAWQYTLTDKGSARARERIDRMSYVGPAPVQWEDYITAIKAQGGKQVKVNPDIMNRALSHMILEPALFHKIGPAVNSGKSIFLYGPPGNGKTTIAESIGRMVLGGDMYIPYAVEADGQIIKVYDEVNHVAVPDTERLGTGPLGGGRKKRRDARWIRIRRPVIMVGGELTLEGLELNFDETNKYYEAPFQMKANGGMFLIDDFGRQQVRPRDLLNRWIVPMEKQIDFLGLHTGRKLEVPFEVLIVFSTNLPPRDLVDEAFLRRIRHKIEVTSPTYEGFRIIFQRVCEARNIPFDEQAVVYLLQEYYVKPNRKLRSNHPRDLIEQMEDIIEYRGTPFRLTKELIDRAAESYFVDL
jgi:predicted ATPase with chaperone activity